jgi:hypothetical protein
MTSHQRKAEFYRKENLGAARIIAADSAKYPAGSLPAIWAAMVLNPPAERTAPAIRRAG